MTHHDAAEILALHEAEIQRCIALEDNATAPFRAHRGSPVPPAAFAAAQPHYEARLRAIARRRAAESALETEVARCLCGLHPEDYPEVFELRDRLRRHADGLISFNLACEMSGDEVVFVETPTHRFGRVIGVRGNPCEVGRIGVHALPTRAPVVMPEMPVRIELPPDPRAANYLRW